MTAPESSLTILAQRELRDLHLYFSVIDGVWGPHTQSAFDVYKSMRRYENATPSTIHLSKSQASDVDTFYGLWLRNRDRYKYIAAKADVPALLIAAIHMRESGCNFTTYLHNGDPLGKPTVNEPKGILFIEWEPSAIDALMRETAAREHSLITSTTDSIQQMLVFAEYYNGTGYLKRDIASPYTLAGTSLYKKGKFTSDGHFDPEAVDSQPGIYPLLARVN